MLNIILSTALLLPASVASWGTVDKESMCSVGMHSENAGIQLVNTPQISTVLTISHPEISARASVFRDALKTSSTCRMVGGSLDCQANQKQDQSPILQFLVGSDVIEFDGRKWGGVILSDGKLTITTVSGRMLETIQRASVVRIGFAGESVAEVSLAGSSKAVTTFNDCSRRYDREVKYYVTEDISQ